MRLSRIASVLALVLCAGAGMPRAAVAEAPASSHVAPRDKDATLAKAYRFERDGWIYVHLEGSPHDIGFQHGVLLANEIVDSYAAIQLNMTHSTGRDWDFFRRASRQMLWPKIDPEYQQELQGIADGLASKRVKLDLEDVIAMNAFMEIADYYV